MAKVQIQQLLDFPYRAETESNSDSAIQWRQVFLRDICQPERRIVEPFSSEAQALPYLSLEHIEPITGRILKEPSVMADSGPVHDEGRSTTFYFDQRHVLYCKLRPYLNKVALPDFAGRCTTELIPLVPQAGIAREFLAWLLRRPQTVEAAMQQKTGARMPRADMNHVFSLKVWIPDRFEDQVRLALKIAAELDLVIKAKNVLEKQKRLLDAYIERTLIEFPEPRSSHESVAALHNWHCDGTPGLHPGVPSREAKR